MKSVILIFLRFMIILIINNEDQYSHLWIFIFEKHIYVSPQFEMLPSIFCFDVFHTWSWIICYVRCSFLCYLYILDIRPLSDVELLENKSFIFYKLPFCLLSNVFCLSEDFQFYEFLFQNICIDCLEIHIIHPLNIHFPILPDLPFPSCNLPSLKKEYCAICGDHILIKAWLNFQW